MSEKRDPRIAELLSRSGATASDMPRTEPPQPAAHQHPPQHAHPDRQQDRNAAAAAAAQQVVVPRKRFRWANRPAWLTTFLSALGVFLLCGLIYYAAYMVSDAMLKNQRRQVYSDVWQTLVSNNVAINGTPTRLNELGEPEFKSLSFEGIRSQSELHRHLRLAATLPGVQRLTLTTDPTRALGQSIADDLTMDIVAANYGTLAALDLSGTTVNSLKAAESLKLQELRLINTAIRADKLSELKYLDTITDLYIGWTGNAKDAEIATYLSEGYHAKVVESIMSMKGLRSLYLYEFKLTPEERTQINGRFQNLNIVDLR